MYLFALTLSKCSGLSSLSRYGSQAGVVAQESRRGCMKRYMGDQAKREGLMPRARPQGSTEAAGMTVTSANLYISERSLCWGWGWWCQVPSG